MKLRPTCAVPLVLVLASSRANALQPLESFVASARQNNPDNREALANARQKKAQQDVATAAYLPSFTAQGVYTRNQYEAAFDAGGTQVVIQAQNGLDAYLTLAVPIINVGAWENRKSARLEANAASASALGTQTSVESNVTQAYYQLLGSEAVRFAARKSVDAAVSNLKTVNDRTELGTASQLDVQRATADVARAEQDLATAEQQVVSGRRSLESLARLTPEPATASSYREDDLHAEPPLSTFMHGDGDDLIPVRSAVASREAAAASRTAAQAAWLPAIAAQGQERITNAGGFTGRSRYYTLTATATWKLDFSLGPTVRARTAALNAAEAREDKARRNADDAIYQAWHQVSLGLEKARAARAQVKSATLAQDLARDRYTSGVATQLEVVQAQRDFFSSAVSQAQADFDLQYARAQLRIAARRTTTEEKAR